jgi:transcriptional regulator with XRE-family HTH domain
MDTIRTKRHRKLIEILVIERKKRKIMQTDLARKIKRSQTWIARIENGGRRIDVVEFLLLVEALGLDAAKIIRIVRDAGRD